MTSLPSLRSTLRSFASAWNAFFFEPVDLRTCAAVRIAFSVCLLVNLATLGPRLFDWFAADGLMRDLPLYDFIAPGSWDVLSWLPPTRTAVAAVYVIAIAQACLLLVGLGTRFQALGCFVWLVTFQNRNPMLCDGEDTVFRLMAALLVLMPCGAVWSLDRWLVQKFRRTPPPTMGPAWALKLLQLQMAVIFFDTFFAKSQGEPWQDGTALYYVARLEEFFPRFPLPAALFDSLPMIRLMTWGTLAVELLVPIFVWFRETRRLSLLVAVAFHLVCDYSMYLLLFHWIMLTGWMAFLRPEDWQAIAALWPRSKAQSVRQPARDASTNSQETSLAACAMRR